MNADRFDDIVRADSAASRRGLAIALSGMVLVGPLRMVVGIGEAGAKKKKKSTLCLDGQTIQVSRKKKKKLLKQGATPGACPICTPDCNDKMCGDDGCGSTCGACSLCQECQGGQCVNEPNDTPCPAADAGRCRDGTCNSRPQCGTLGNVCMPDRVCCYQEPGDLCPFNGKCEELSANGHRCRFGTDCASGRCVGYICDPV